MTEMMPCEYCGEETRQRAGDMVAHQECYNEAGGSAPKPKKAFVEAVLAIQVSCPACGGLCRSLSWGALSCLSVRPEAASEAAGGEIPVIFREQEHFQAVCIRCEGVFSLPTDAFVPRSR